MRNRYVAVVAGMFITMGVLAQGKGENFLKNGGFEDLSKPVTTWQQINRATGWSNPNTGSADLFSKGASPKTVGIPDNDLGTGTTAFEGESYAGFVAYKQAVRKNWKHILNGQEEVTEPAYQSYSEYVQSELTSPLVAGQKYDVTFHVKLASHSSRAVNAIGAYLSPIQLGYHNNGFLQEKPQVSASKIVNNKQDWTEVTGTFTADGTEKYIIIGAFINAGFESEKVAGGPDNKRAYYYLDGISLKEHPEEDRDGDGVPDKVDRCPDVAGLASLEGCPDRDGDGIADDMDACPDVAGPASFNGCPDTDGDGIPDNLDRCPTAKGPASNNGCPEISEKTKKLFEKALTGIQFETGKSAIKASSYSILNQVVDVMKENSTYDLEIHGHTDSQGDDAKNLKLSEDRAAAVRTYLEGKGISGDRMKSFGHGETEPVADNATATGRAKNRRVEFKVTFWR
ncbi:MAG TPA: OmpA family protein [Flavobacteriales bacterium]|nr:OmpA family protein [Flavobacteriales bacterium]HRP80875.1 OmpA family protein [Flavobacteriales bacterium]HRQ86068.1 OmpA family protein [Flavobacteriales bacterium]